MRMRSCGPVRLQDPISSKQWKHIIERLPKYCKHEKDEKHRIPVACLWSAAKIPSWPINLLRRVKSVMLFVTTCYNFAIHIIQLSSPVNAYQVPGFRDTLRAGLPTKIWCFILYSQAELGPAPYPVLDALGRYFQNVVTLDIEVNREANKTCSETKNDHHYYKTHKLSMPALHRSRDHAQRGHPTGQKLNLLPGKKSRWKQILETKKMRRWLLWYCLLTVLEQHKTWKTDVLAVFQIKLPLLRKTFSVIRLFGNIVQYRTLPPDSLNIYLFPANMMMSELSLNQQFGFLSSRH